MKAFLGTVLFLTSFVVMAGGRHHYPDITNEVINNYNEYSTINQYSTDNQLASRGVAISIATAQHQFNWSTYSWQGSVGMGFFNSYDAVSFAIGKRFDRTLIVASIAFSGSEVAGGGSVNWQF